MPSISEGCVAAAAPAREQRRAEDALRLLRGLGQLEVRRPEGRAAAEDAGDLRLGLRRERGRVRPGPSTRYSVP